MTKVVFPGCFDPVTVGHLSVIERASRLFSEVHIAIVENQSTAKQLMWSIEERTKFMQEAVSHIPKVTVHVFSGLLVHFLKQLQIPVIIRGVRSAVDWNYESELFQVHQILWPEIEMLGLPSLAQYDVVSSSFVREIWKLGGDISAMVPPKVLELMQESR